VIEEMTVKRIRMDRRRTRRERPWREILPPDPRDPDVVRAKALARGTIDAAGIGEMPASQHEGGRA
jgi:hypothetical protein